MRIGVDGRKIPESAKRGAVGSIQHAKGLGMDGIFFRTVLDMSPSLDVAQLMDIRHAADDLGLYLETGLGKVNPFANPEAPELRAIGDGDIVKGFQRMMEACAEIDCRELWVATANYKPGFMGRWAYDRFRSDVSWQEQLIATSRFLQKLAPIARNLGIHMNLETHEEITSFEVVRLVEEVGSDVTGIVFDTANVLQRVEHPVWAARRVAPYVRQTHIKDALISHHDGDLVFQLRPCGSGVVNFTEVIPEIAHANPDLNLSIENEESLADRPRDRAAKMIIEVYEPEFLHGHPDLTVDEMAAYMEMVHEYELRILQGDVPSEAEYASMPFGYVEAVAFACESAEHLRRICAEAGLP